LTANENLYAPGNGAAAPPKATRREWIGLGVLMLPTLLIAMDLTVLHLAVPAISRDLKPSSSQLLWIIDIYGFLIAGSLISMGALGDRIGRRKLLMFGAFAFGAASVLAAFSTSAPMLIATRALLGVAGATLMPSTMSLLRNMFLDPKQRTTAIGVWVSGFSAGSAIGPLIGGGLLEHFWWGSVFLLGVPVMVILVISAPKLLPEYRDPNPGRIDLVSAGMSLAAVLAVIFGVKQFAENGAGLVPIVAVVTGLTVGIAFLDRQRKLKDPFIDVRLFRVPAFSASLGVNTVGIFALFGIFVFMSQYLQLVAGLSPFQAGLWTLPGAVAFIIGSNTAPMIVRRVRPAYMVGAGFLLAGLGVALATQAGSDSLPLIIASWTIVSIGMAPAFTLTSDMIMTAAPPERAGAAAAMSETGNELGGALGIAVIGSIGTAVYRSHVESGMPAWISPESAHIAQDTLGGALSVAADLPAEAGAALINAAQAAFVDGLQVTAVIGAALILLTAGVAALSLRNLRHSSAYAQPELATALAEPAVEPAPTGMD
jgi:DHA2 family multidrug resistance protein-like MFS transporter